MVMRSKEIDRRKRLDAEEKLTLERQERRPWLGLQAPGHQQVSPSGKPRKPQPFARFGVHLGNPG